MSATTPHLYTTPQPSSLGKEQESKGVFIIPCYFLFFCSCFAPALLPPKAPNSVVVNLGLQIWLGLWNLKLGKNFIIIRIVLIIFVISNPNYLSGIALQSQVDQQNHTSGPSPPCLPPPRIPCMPTDMKLSFSPTCICQEKKEEEEGVFPSIHP